MSSTVIFLLSTVTLNCLETTTAISLAVTEPKSFPLAPPLALSTTVLLLIFSALALAALSSSSALNC